MRRPAAVLLAATWLAVGCADPTQPPGERDTSGGAGSPPASAFVDRTAAAGLDFDHETGAAGRLLLPEVMGGGVALLDVDNDGDLDAYLTNGNRGAGDDSANRLFLQQADGGFVDATASSGLGDTGYGMGVAAGDIDNDGDVDLYLTNVGRDRLYRNRGDGTFDEVSEAAGVDIEGWSASATFFDFDGDGFLDLWVSRYVRYDPAKGCTDAAGRPDYCSPAAFPPETDRLLRNDGRGGFVDVSGRAGIESSIGAGLGVVAADLNGDGRPDVYVANDGDPNHLWINQGDGTFREEALLHGAAYDLHGRAEAGMGVLAADLDNDLDPDLFLTHLASESNTFYRNQGGGGFVDASGAGGLATSSLMYTGFGTAAVDLQLDGFLDLVIVNGRVTLGELRSGSGLPAPWNRLAEPNLLYRNLGDGTFELDATGGGDLTRPVEVSRGLATGDVDGDGAVDLLLGNLHSGARLLLDSAEQRGHWLGVRALDPRYRREAIGAQVTVVAGDLRQWRIINRGFSYLSSSDPTAHFGLGARSEVDRLEVRWPDGLVESFAAEGVDRVRTLLRGSGLATEDGPR